LARWVEAQRLLPDRIRIRGATGGAKAGDELCSAGPELLGHDVANAGEALLTQPLLHRRVGRDLEDETVTGELLEGLRVQATNVSQPAAPPERFDQGASHPPEDG